MTVADYARLDYDVAELQLAYLDGRALAEWAHDRERRLRDGDGLEDSDYGA